MKRRVPLAVFILAFSSACNHNRYTVIQRTDETTFWVKIALKHNGHKLYATCNNYKATPGDPDKTESCNLHVGQSIDCQFFADRLSPDAGGYNLICGNQRKAGKLTNDGRNELLIVEREEW